MSRWYRAYEGTVTDAKLAEVAMVAGCSRSVVIASWHAILENAACVNDGGRIDIPSRRIAAILCEPFDTIETVMMQFECVGLIEGSQISAWKRRQYESDSSTERSKRHRANKRNADATLQQQHATPPETETDTYIPLANANGPADEPKATPEEIKKAIWRNGRELLEPAGYTPKQAGSLIGKWVKTHGEGATMSAILRARAIGPPEPLEFVQGFFRNEARKVKCEVPLI